MAKTINQIQSLIDSQSLDARQLINLIADYLQANPGGGGTQGIDDVLAQGQALTADRTVDLNAKVINFMNGIYAALSLSPTAVTGEINDGVGSVNFQIINDPGDNNVRFRFNVNDGTANPITIDANAITSTFEYTADRHIFHGSVEPGYKSYVSTITQSGTNAPVANVFTDTIGIGSSWAYNSVGNYTLSWSVNINKLFVSGVPLDGAGEGTYFVISLGATGQIRLRISSSELTLISQNAAGDTQMELGDLLVGNIFCLPEIRLYP